MSDKIVSKGAIKRNTVAQKETVKRATTTYESNTLDLISSPQWTAECSEYNAKLIEACQLRELSESALSTALLVPHNTPNYQQRTDSLHTARSSQEELLTGVLQRELDTFNESFNGVTNTADFAESLFDLPCEHQHAPSRDGSGLRSFFGDSLSATRTDLARLVSEQIPTLVSDARELEQSVDLLISSVTRGSEDVAQKSRDSNLRGRGYRTHVMSSRSQQSADVRQSESTCRVTKGRAMDETFAGVESSAEKLGLFRAKRVHSDRRMMHKLRRAKAALKHNKKARIHQGIEVKTALEAGSSLTDLRPITPMEIVPDEGRQLLHSPARPAGSTSVSSDSCMTFVATDSAKEMSVKSDVMIAQRAELISGVPSGRIRRKTGDRKSVTCRNVSSISGDVSDGDDDFVSDSKDTLLLLTMPLLKQATPDPAKAERTTTQSILTETTGRLQNSSLATSNISQSNDPPETDSKMTQEEFGSVITGVLGSGETPSTLVLTETSQRHERHPSGRGRSRTVRFSERTRQSGSTEESCESSSRGTTRGVSSVVERQSDGRLELETPSQEKRPVYIDKMHPSRPSETTSKHDHREPIWKNSSEKQKRKSKSKHSKHSKKSSRHKKSHRKKSRHKHSKKKRHGKRHLCKKCSKKGHHHYRHHHHHHKYMSQGGAGRAAQCECPVVGYFPTLSPDDKYSPLFTGYYADPDGKLWFRPPPIVYPPFENVPPAIVPRCAVAPRPPGTSHLTSSATTRREVNPRSHVTAEVTARREAVRRNTTR